MKKKNFFIFLVFLFALSCSGGDDLILSCITVSDCPDSSYSCQDGFCVQSGAVVDPGDLDGDTLPDDEKNSGGDTSDSGENDKDDETDSELPNPVTGGDDDILQDSDVTEENDEDSIAADDEDSFEDGDGEGDDGEDADTVEEADFDNENESDDDTLLECTNNEDCLSNPNNIRCDTASGKCVMCLSDADCLASYGQSCDLTTHECVSDKTCAAAIEKLPHGGNFDWEDGTTQGFTTNAYWELVSSNLLPAEQEPVLTHGGNYSFGNYSGYADKMDYTSVLSSADLSLCAACSVETRFYVRGRVPTSENGYDFIQPVCNGEGTTTAKNSTGGTQSYSPQSPWTDENSSFYNKVNSYSNQKWTKLEWALPAECKTDSFVFGLRFSSSSSINYQGLVVDNLTIAPAATNHEPDGVFESALGGYLKGWSCDLDAHAKNVLVKVEYYKNKDESAVAAVRWAYAKLQRLGDSELKTRCSETYNHGFEIPFDSALAEIMGEGTHSVAVFAVDIPATENSCAGTYKKLGDTKEFVFSAEM